MQQQTTSAWIFQELSSVFENQIPSTYKHFYIDLQTNFPLVSLFFPYFPLVVVFMLDHFYSIISMTSNDEKALKKRSIQGCKATLVAAKCAPPEALRAGYPDLKRLGTYFGIYLGVGTVIFYALKNDIRGHKTIDFIDSLYLCVVTMTTVGYGDLVPHSYNAQLVCIFFITVGMCLFGIAVKIAAKYLVVKQQMVMVNALRMSRKIGPVEALKEIESVKIDYNKLKISLIAMAGHYVIGILVLLTIEGMDFTDAIYCAFTTMTTTGFGDETFQELFGRMFAVFWISTGTSCVGQLFLYIAEIYTDIETKKLAKQVISNNIIAKTDLEAADDIKDGKVYGAADMILYKLKEKGKIKQDDISVAMKDLNDVIKDVDVDDVTPPKSAQEK